MDGLRIRKIVAAFGAAALLSAGGLACGDDDNGDEVPNVDDSIEEGVDDLEEGVEEGADRVEEGADELEDETDEEREDG
jgi:hypothetical protein